MTEFIRLCIAVLTFLSLFLNGCLFLRFRSRRWIALMLPKMVANSLPLPIAAAGAVGGFLGLLCGMPAAFVLGTSAAVVSILYIRRVSAPHDRFEAIFGEEWQDRIPPERRIHMAKKRWALCLPRTPEPRWDRDVPFHTIPDGTRRLSCDIWGPPRDMRPSGLAVIYLHGGGWHTLDKDFGTRPLFRRLAAQGHVVMDVAYRLCPEVDLYGMLGDVKRAVAWLKAKSEYYGIDRDRIVLAGGSSGAHLALLAAYTSNNPGLTPEDMKGSDLSVRGVVSYYGPTDLRAFFKDGFGRVNDKGRVERMQKNLLGGTADEIPSEYEAASPVSHITPECPATLIFQGEDDCGVPAASTRAFFRGLLDAGVPALYAEFPRTEHGFDIQLKILNLGDGSQYSPAAQAASYDLERFLAVLASMPRVADRRIVDRSR